jgi:hypothetical protein
MKVIDLSHYLRLMADFMEAQGINNVDAEQGKWYTFSVQFMPNDKWGSLKADSVRFVKVGQLYPKKRWWRRAGWQRP